jgi:glycosyltransferase involved in cell wall biosynthesis
LKLQDAICVVGHPFAPNGMGEALRALFRSLLVTGLQIQVRDVYGMHDIGQMDTCVDMHPNLVERVGTKIAIFVLNGDERSQAFRHMSAHLSGGTYNIGVPFWELSRYPEAWAREIDHYDEVWASTNFIYDALSKAVRKPVFQLPLAAQPRATELVSRAHFGIPETSYAFLFAFDFSSYMSRKNPFAVIEAFKSLRKLRPFADVCLVIKLSGRRGHEEAFTRLKQHLEELGDRVCLIEHVETDNYMKNLIRCCDCYISLHRSEGYGFGPAEAMYWGNPVIATSYSGNMDFMTDKTAFLVNYRLIPVGVDEYPYASGQVWAEPDVAQAAKYMTRLVDEPDYGRSLGERASAHIRTYFSYRACGLRYQERLRTIDRERKNLEAS